MRQGTDSLPAYLAKFERTLFEAAANDCPDSAKISTLRAGLNEGLKKKLEVQLILPTTYGDFVKALHQLFGYGKASFGTFTPHNNGHSSSHNPDKMDLSEISINSISTSLPTPESVASAYDAIKKIDPSARPTHKIPRGLDLSCLPAREYVAFEEDSEDYSD